MEKNNIYNILGGKSNNTDNIESVVKNVSDSVRFASITVQPGCKLKVFSKGCVVNMFNGNVAIDGADIKLSSSELLFLGEEDITITNNNEYQIFLNITGTFQYG